MYTDIRMYVLEMKTAEGFISLLIYIALKTFFQVIIQSKILFDNISLVFKTSFIFHFLFKLSTANGMINKV